MADMRKLIESVDSLNEAAEVTPKQVYEWVKTGHWSRSQFEQWLETRGNQLPGSPVPKKETPMTDEQKLAKARANRGYF